MKPLKHVTFYLDFISPYAYLAFEALPKALIGQSYTMAYKPVLFAGMLKHYGQLGPAEIAPKREWTYRQALWLGKELNIPIDLPQRHPFNPLALLRLACACSGTPGHPDGLPNRLVCELIFKHVWRGGLDAADPARLQALTSDLQVQTDHQSEIVKGVLQTNTQEAIEQGVFGVPTFCVDDKVFWGQDALPMLRAYMQNDPWFTDGNWERPTTVQLGQVRKAPVHP